MKLSSSTSKLLLMPGMDGTGELFSWLVQALPKNIDVQIVELNKARYCKSDRQEQFGSQYDAELAYVRSLLGKNKVTLVAESYSGPLAYRLCQDIPEKISQVIFVASFII